MNPFINLLRAELLKLKHARMVGMSFLAFGLAPLMGGMFMVITQNAQMAANAPSLKAKMSMMSLTANWNAYFLILSQAMGVGGILVFGFVASWLFGREYADNTAKDLLAMPVSRTQLVMAKYILYVCWCVALAVTNLLVMLLLGWVLQLPGFSMILLGQQLYVYIITTILAVAINTGVAFMAVWGKGFMAPLGFTALALVFSQIIAAAGFGPYFPWAIPALYSSSASGVNELNMASYLMLMTVSIAGIVSTILWFRLADHEK